MGTDLVVGSDRDVEDVLGHQIPGGAFGQDGHDVATPVQPLALVDGPHLGVAGRNLPQAGAAFGPVQQQPGLSYPIAINPFSW